MGDKKVIYTECDMPYFSAAIPRRTQSKPCVVIDWVFLGIAQQMLFGKHLYFKGDNH